MEIQANAGTIYFSNSFHVATVNANGIGYTSFLGNGELVSTPSGMAWGPSGDLYISVYNAGAVAKYNPTTHAIDNRFISGLQATEGIVADSHGNLYVVSQSSGGVPGSVYKFSETSSTVSLYATGFSTPVGITVDTNDNLYVANNSSGTVSRIDHINQSVTTYATGLNSPTGLAFDTSGNLYVSNFGNGEIDKVSSALNSTVFATGLSRPVGVLFDPSTGGLIVSESANGHLDRISASGQVTTIATGLDDIGFILGDAPSNTSPVPEPASLSLFVIGLTGVGLCALRRRFCGDSGIQA